MTWNTAKSILEIRPKTPLEVFMFRNKIRKAITGESVTEVPSEGVNYKDKNKKLSVGVQPNLINANIESGDSTKDLKILIGLMKQVNNDVGISNIARIGYRTFRYAEIESDSYEEFIDEFKKVYFKETSFIGGSSDLALVGAFTDGAISVNVNIGPMQGSELKDKQLQFSEDLELPSFYIFVDVDISTINIRSSNSEIKKFTDAATQHTEKVLKVIGKDWSTK